MRLRRVSVLLLATALSACAAPAPACHISSDPPLTISASCADDATLVWIADWRNGAASGEVAHACNDKARLTLQTSPVRITAWLDLQDGGYVTCSGGGWL